MEAAMEDIVLMKVLFVTGLLALSGMALVLAYVIARLGERGRVQVGRVRSRPAIEDIPVRGTR
jgi:hypothetical protein